MVKVKKMDSLGAAELLRRASEFDFPRTFAEYQRVMKRTLDAHVRMLIAEFHQKPAAKRIEKTAPAPAIRFRAGENCVRTQRERRGMRQAELARRAGLNTGYVYHIESGRSPGSIDAMTKIAKALNVRLSDLAS